MRTLIIPCAGKSSRFPGMKTKWLLTHPDGELMIQKAISGFKMEDFDRIIITMVKHHSEKFEAKLITEQVFAINSESKIEILELDDFTSCQAETVYETIFRKNVKGEFIVKDSDNYVGFDWEHKGCFIVGLDVNKSDKEIFRLKSKSFLMINNQKIITDIIEKEIKSSHICLGVYGFENTEIFLDAYKYLVDNKINSNEIYLSHIIAYLIGMNKAVFKYNEATDFEDWGTLEDWRNTQKKFSTYFFDIDGVLLKNRGKYGSKNWSNDFEVLKENLEVLKKLNKEGGQIIFTTSRNEAFREKLEIFFKDEGIKFHALIMNCNHATRILINDFAPTNPYPSCKAISFPRNANLRDYIE